MAAVRTSDVYLNTLCLAAWAPGAASLKIAKAVIAMYNNASMEEKALISPMNKLYIQLIKDVISEKLHLDNRSEAQNLLMQYQDDPAFQESKMSFNELKEMLTPEVAPGLTAIKKLFRKVKNHIVWAENSRRLRMMMIRNMRAGSMDGDEEKQQELLEQVMKDASEFSEIYNSQNLDPEDEALAPVEEIDFDDERSVIRGFQQQERKRVGTNIRFGLQGFSRMFGPSGGAAYGEFFCAAARSHNYKSGLLMDMCRWQCVYNHPPETGGKMPLILFISLENEIGENLHMWWQQCYINLFHKMPDNMTHEEMAKQVIRTMTKNGFHLKIFRKFGDDFGFDDFVKLVNKYEEQGYKVVTTYLDYLGLCKPSKQDLNRRDDLQLVYLARRFKDFCQHHNMFLATGWQMDSDASRLKSSGTVNVVQRYSEAHLANAKALKNELDMLIFMEIEVNASGIPFLTFAWNKHKYVNNTPQEDKYCAYRFNDHLGMYDDINGKDQSVKDIYAENDTGRSEEEISIF